MLELTFIWEVELDLFLLSGVRTQRELIAINLFCEHQRERAVGDLTEKVYNLALWRDVGHNDFAFIWLINDHVFCLILVVMVI